MALKSSLLHDNVFTKSYKSQIHILALFYESQILFWLYFTKLKYYFGTTLQSPNLFWQLFIKAQNYFLAKYILRSLAHGKYKLLTSQEYFFQQNLWELCLFFHNQLTTKVHVYHVWQNFSFCRDNQAQRSSTTRSS